jgi:small ligand-binding sensory domain FIST
MRWSSVVSRQANPWKAAEETAAAVRDALGDGPPDLVLAFWTAPLAAAAEEIHATLARLLDPVCLGGVSAAGVIAAAHEIERGEALVVLGARLPGVTVSPFVLPAAEWAAPIDSAEDFARHAPGAAGAEIALLFGDPFSLDPDGLLATFNRHAPELRLVGGLASAGQRPGDNAIFLNQWFARDGGFAVALSGAVRADVVVSQGCRPVGPPLTATRVRRNLLLELDGMPAAERVREVVTELPEDDQQLLERGLFFGRPVTRGASGRGEYLIRNVLGHDPESGALAIGDLVAEGERVRLHLRDARTAREDLELLLAPQTFDSPAAAALLFSCNGRGRNLYAEPNGDITPLQQALGGSVPAGGFFCAGEIGPVGGRNFLHGHTASIAILRPR